MGAPAAGSLDYAERWLRDGLHVLRPAFSASQVTVDMANAMARLEQFRRDHVNATATHLVVHAAAKALASNPALHQVVAGWRRHRPAHVDIGLSVGGETFVAPVLVLKGADQKTVEELVAETTLRTPEVRAEDGRLLRLLRRWGWLVPFAFLRRSILRLLFASPWFRRQGAGTFQVSSVPADWALSSTFSAAGVLFSGQVRSAVVAVDGHPAVRPMMTLTLCADHGVWDGANAARFLAAVKGTLERTHA